ncbi:MAG: hypothetical protein ACLGHT_00285 [Acidimicrobiia bacterium]
MFVQLIEAKVSDTEGFRRLMQRWTEELRPGAKGFLGSTGGVAEDGRAVLAARFESPEAAQANSDRSEQGEWWAEMEKCLEGNVSFNESTDVELFPGGDLDSAGFVQVMKYPSADREQLRKFDEMFERVGQDFRPDVLGGYRIWTGADSCVELMYFTSEAEAREGEKKPPPPELASAMGDFESLMANVEFIDLKQPEII